MRADPRATAPTLGLARVPPRIFRWTALGAFVLVAATVAVRLLVSSSHPRPAISFSRDLLVEAPRAGLAFSADSLHPRRYGLEPGDLLVEAAGVRVADREALGRAIDGGRDDIVELRFDRQGGAGGTKTLHWVELPGWPNLDVRADGLRLPGDMGALANEAVLRVNDTAVTDRASLDRALGTAPSSELRFGLEPGANGDERELVVVRLRWLTQWVVFFSGLGFAALGFTALWLQPGTRSSWGFVVFCAHFALFALFRSIPFLYRSGIERHIFLLLQCFLPASTYLFLATFTPLRLLLRRSTPTFAVAIAFGAALIGLNWVLSPAEAAAGILTEPLLLVWAGSALALVLMGQAVDLIVRLTGRRLGPVDRQRGWVLRFATACGFLPTIAYVAFLVVLPLPGLRLWFDLTVLLFPLIVAYAIVRHNFLALDELAREALLFGSLLAAFAVGSALLGAGLTPVVERWAPSMAASVQPLAVAALVVVVAPLHTRLRRRLHERFQRLPVSWQELSAKVEAAAKPERAPAEYAREVVEQLAGNSRARRVLLLVRNSHNDSWWLAAAAGLKVDEPGPQVGDARTLAALLGEEDSLLIRDQVLDDLRYRELRPHLVQVLDRLQASLVVPLRLERHLWGLLVLGDKGDGHPWSPTELQALRRLAPNAARHLDVLIREDLVRRERSVIDLLPDLPVTIGGYRIERLLGKGGMSYVYLGLGDRGRVAIKVANHKVHNDAKLLQRFLRESRALERLDHPNIVRIHRVGQEGRDAFIAMEYLAEGSLDRLVTGGNLPAEAFVVSLLTDISRGLRAALAEGVLHRDVKPSNIFRSDDGAAKIGDFGLARFTDETTITTEGRIFGTPAYISPEQVRGLDVTWKADQYSLGITAWELLAGERPFNAPTLESMLYQHVHEPLPSLEARRPGLCGGTLTVIERMAKKKASDRFDSYDDVIDALETVRRAIEGANPRELTGHA